MYPRLFFFMGRTFEYLLSFGCVTCFIPTLRGTFTFYSLCSETSFSFCTKHATEPAPQMMVSLYTQNFAVKTPRETEGIKNEGVKKIARDVSG
jgi:hypothetical protein